MIYQYCIDASVSFVELSGLVRCRVGRYLPVATPRLGQRRRTQTAKFGCGDVPRVSCDTLGEGSGIVETPCYRTGFAFAGTRSRSVTVRSGGYEPPFCQHGGWTIAVIRKTDNLLCRMARPFIRTQKRPHFALRGKMQASLTFDFFRLTLAAPAYSMCTAIHIEKKSQAFMKYNLGFDNTGNPQIVCGAANLLRNSESIHSLQVALYYQIPRWFVQTKKA